MRRFSRFGIAGIVMLGAASCQLPPLGARLILHPGVRRVHAPPPVMARDVSFTGEGGIRLRGWQTLAEGERRGTLIYLHGVADNRVSGAGVMERFRKRGFDVITYDSRAHGESGGAACTYGFLEKKDLRRVIDTLDPGPVVVIGASLGAAVALQLAAEDPRISAVVAAESFSDLETALRERVPGILPPACIESTIRLTEMEGGFLIAEIKPAEAARRVKVPVLIVHGAADRETPACHAIRIYEALAGPRKLILVPGAGHNKSLGGAVWEEIEAWVDGVVGPPR
jgi:uncharacterized protein